MSFVPLESSPYVSYSSSSNELFLDLVNPFGVMTNFAVQVISPLLPSYDEELGDEPDYDLDDFLVWGKPFEQYLDEGENSSLYPLFYALSVIAKLRVRWALIGEENTWKQLVSLYIAHYLELHIDLLKDEANRFSMNPFEKDKDYKYTFEVGGKVFDDFKSTKYGRIFWLIVEPILRFQHWGINY